MASRKKGRGDSALMVLEDLWGGWRAQALVTAIDLDVFAHLAANKRTVGQLAAATHATPRGMRGLLDALVAMRYLGKRGDRYNLRRPAELFLVPGRQSYVGAMASVTRATWEDWPRLAEVIRSGRPCGQPGRSGDEEERYAELAGALFGGNHRAALAAVETFPPRRLQPIHDILDAAAGSGAWSIAFAKALPEARVTALDFPAVLAVTRRFARSEGVEQRYSFRGGDLRKADLGKESYDLVILGHILHSFGPSDARELIRRSAAALRPGGSLLVADFLPNDVRTGPLLPLLFGLNMLLHTEQGDAYTLREYRTWIREAGLHVGRLLSVGAASPLILGTK